MADDGVDRFDHLPDSLLLLVFNKIGDVKALGRCSAVSKRFQTLVPQVENDVVRVDCVISDDDSSSSASSAADKSRSPISSLFCICLVWLVSVCGSILIVDSDSLICTYASLVYMHICIYLRNCINAQFCIMCIYAS